ncbi:MAG: hypothetical protein Q7T39_03875, partial [Polaromonas sp.]|nr:hypothetical protein [Polaromonas sp.]
RVAASRERRRGLTRLPEATWLEFAGTTALLLLTVRGVLRLLLQAAQWGNAFAVQEKLPRREIHVSGQHIEDTSRSSVES